MRVQDRYAPSTATMSAIPTNTAPHGPTTASSTPATDGCGSAAISSRGRMPKDTIVTEAKIASTLRYPRTVARPTSRRRRACREYALAPSMPMKANTVNSSVPRTCSNIGIDASPLRFAANTAGSKAKRHRNTKTAIGSTFATLTMRLTAAASRAPRRTSRKKTQRATDETATATGVSPSPSAGTTAPTVDMMSTQ